MAATERKFDETFCPDPAGPTAMQPKIEGRIFLFELAVTL